MKFPVDQADVFLSLQRPLIYLLPIGAKLCSGAKNFVLAEVHLAELIHLVALFAAQEGKDCELGIALPPHLPDQVKLSHRGLVRNS